MARNSEKLIRISFDLTPEMFGIIENLSEADGISKSELFRRSVGVYAIVRENAKEGLSLSFTKNTTIVKQLVLPYWFIEDAATIKPVNTINKPRPSAGSSGGSQKNRQAQASV